MRFRSNQANCQQKEIVNHYFMPVSLTLHVSESILLNHSVFFVGAYFVFYRATRAVTPEYEY